jgi:hypothetical protein
MPTYGTRSFSRFHQRLHDAGGSINYTHSADPGLSKLATASMTFVNSAAQQVQAANGTFPNFAVGDEIEVVGAVLNSGYFIVTAIDDVNQSYLTLLGGVKDEGPITATVRTR